MNNIEDEILTEEELDGIAGGRSYVYEIIQDPKKGIYYKCTTTDGLKKICIGANRWQEWLDKLAKNGDTIKPLEK